VAKRSWRCSTKCLWHHTTCGTHATSVCCRRQAAWAQARRVAATEHAGRRMRMNTTHAQHALRVNTPYLSEHARGAAGCCAWAQPRLCKWDPQGVRAAEEFLLQLHSNASVISCNIPRVSSLFPTSKLFTVAYRHHKQESKFGAQGRRRAWGLTCETAEVAA